MDSDFWRKQTTEPLFPDLQWSRPENKRYAGKLLIIGGNLHGFAAPATAYQEAQKAGIGVGKVLLPDALKKTVGRILENGEYAPSTPSGSFNKQAQATWMEWAQWADAVLLAGDLGRNSETAVAIERFTELYSGPLTITKDAVDYFNHTASLILNRSKTTLVLSVAQLQKLSREALPERPLKFSFGLPQLVEWLHDFTETHQANLVTYHHEHIIAASQGQVTTTNVGNQETWRVKIAAHSAVWWLQNNGKPLEAITVGVFESFQAQ